MHPHQTQTDSHTTKTQAPNQINGCTPDDTNSRMQLHSDISQNQARSNGRTQYLDKSVIKKLPGHEWMTAADDAQREAAPMQSFERPAFNELMDTYEGVNGNVKSAIELSQAMLMTTNHKETAANIGDIQLVSITNQNSSMSASHQKTNGQQGSTKSTSQTANGANRSDKVGSTPEAVSSGQPYFFKQDYMADLSKKCATKDFEQVAKLLPNLGLSDKSSNWLLEQRNLLRSQAPNEKEISSLIEDKSVDNQEYARAKENIARAKQRAGAFLEPQYSDGEQELQEYNGNHDHHMTSAAELETEEDSGQAQRNGRNDNKINGIIKKIRQNAQSILGNKDGKDYSQMSLSQVCKRLRKNPAFLNKREAKQLSKGDVSEQVEKLQSELNLYAKHDQEYSDKNTIVKRISKIEQVLGLEKRMKTKHIESTLAELDMKPMSTEAFDIQNILFDYCGINFSGSKIDEDTLDSFSHQKRVERVFSKIRKMPKKACILSNLEDNLLNPNQEERLAKAKEVKSNQELVKVVGLEPQKLFEKIPKYKVQVGKMPKFSNTFDSIESVMPGFNNKNSIPGQQIINSLSSNLNFNRVDGKQVISLQFNPFFISDDMDKKKIYDSYMREIIEQRDKIKNAPKDAKLKQETANIKRAWANIVKKDIPKAFRLYQKFKADQENNNKKLSQNCLKEVRKRAVKTQRLAKESVMRARKLTKEMCHYWRKRDKEIADSKRKREKIDKEFKKRQQEEEEMLLQKKRLEYLMQQSEIYAHFMATKLGVSEELKQSKDGHQGHNNKRLEIDMKQARQNIAEMINENRKRLDDFDDHDRDEVNEDDLDVQKFASVKVNEQVQKPDMFLGDLKAYQLKGLQWLDNLYDQGINGILADEMGLGKTIQTIALLAHLAEKKGVWGPFLIVVPVTTLHNWQNELTKFCPTLKCLPYFGSAEERKKLAKFLDPKNLYNPAMSIHVLITSYNLIAGGGKDQMRLQRVKWHYMILDEAQAIKNNSSRRWKTLLNFNTRNRLLLSGTPIQNSMAELWALLHFIMPKLFDNHEQFQEWFSKDIEQHSMDQGELNKHQLKRLHLILQPFMLRRLKKDVEQEIAPKVEEIIHCDMTHRQKVLYDRIKRKISAADLFQLASSKQKMENLMNLVMQFRKVCNHPDLFERRMGKIPFMFNKMQTGMIQNMSVVSKPDIFIANQNPILYNLPKLVFDECFMVTDNNMQLFTKHAKYLDPSMATVSVETHFGLFNIFSEQNLHHNIFDAEPASLSVNKTFSILGLLLQSNKWGVSDLSFMASTDPLMQTVSMMHYYHQRYHKMRYLSIHQADEDQIHLPFGHFGMVSPVYKPARPDIIVNSFVCRDESFSIYRSHSVENLDLDVPGFWTTLEPIVPEHPKEFLRHTLKLSKMMNIYYDNCIAEPVGMECGSSSFKRMFATIKFNPIGMKAMLGSDFKPKKLNLLGKVGQEQSSFLAKNRQLAIMNKTGYQLIDQGLLKSHFDLKGSSSFQLPDYSRLVTDCSKMKILAGLLARLNKGGHRVLLFCQMTRMMDLLEDFLIWQKYSYFRMDGQTQLQDRRFMVEEFQNNPNIFIFILSTRAGGLGINLIAADTVIFYDNDWNPTMDSQATDRAHRIGQKKKVHVYRLVTKNSVEERILKRARQKENVQSTVYGANLKADSFSTRDVLDMIIDDIDDPLAHLGQNRNQVKGFIKTGPAQKKEQKPKKKKKEVDGDKVYESVKRSSVHNKFENEIDQLLNEAKTIEIQEEKPDADMNRQASSGEDDEASEESDQDIENAELQSATDRKKFLLKMLEKQTGGANIKQVFNFEEEDNIVAPKANVEKQVRRGRPANTNNKMQLEDDDEEMEGEEPEY